MLVSQLIFTDEEVRKILEYAMLPEMLTLGQRKHIAERINACIEEKVYCCPKVYGIVSEEGVIGISWRRTPYTSTYGRSTHVGQLIQIRNHRGVDGEL